MTGSAGAPSPSLSEQERRRVEEVDRLTASGAAGIAPLVEMLGDRSWTVRRAVVAGLGALGQPALGPLCAFLVTRRGDESALAAAVDALVASTGPADAAVAALVKGDAPARPAVAADVAQVLGRRRSAAELPTVMALAGHADDNVAVAAMEALGRIGGRAAIETLVAAAGSGNFFRTFPAIDVLGRTGDPRAVACLAELLASPRYRLEAARALGQSGDRAAVAPLGALLAAPSDADVRMGAAALVELRRRHGARSGATAAVDEALRQAAAGPAVAARLGAARAGGEAGEREAVAELLGFADAAASAPLLIELLGQGSDGAADGPAGIARAAAASLQRLGAPGEAAIAHALAAGDSRRRAALLPLVHRVAAASEVLACLGDADPAVRAAACDALGRMGNTAAARSLVGLLEDRNPGVVQAAIGALQALGGTEILGLAMAAAASPSAAVRRAAVRVLGYLGYEAALPVLLGALGDVDARVRDVAVAGLAYFDGAPALEALLAILTAGDRSSERMRAASARALGQRAGEPAALDALIAVTADADAWVRYYAVQSLGKLAAPASARGAAAAEAIARRLDDPAAQVRLGAIEALSRFSSASGQRALERAARSDDADTRRAAVIGLGLGGWRAALPILVEATASPDAATRLVAFSAIATFEPRAGDGDDAAPGPSPGTPPPSIVDALVAGAADPDETVRRSALQCLGARGDATAALAAMLRATPDDAAVQAALSAPSPRRIAELAAALRVADDEMAPHLAWALARMRAPAATAALVDALAGAGNPAARKAAAPALAALAGDDARRALRQAAAHDPDPEVRRVSTLLLGP